MIQLFDKPVNNSVVVTAKISGTTLPLDFVVLKDGAVNGTLISFSNLNAAGLSNFTFTPTTTGTYTLYGDSQVIATVEVVTRTAKSYLANLEDEAMGSWQWDKASGSLNMLRQDGTALASFQVIDDLTTSSRERT